MLLRNCTFMHIYVSAMGCRRTCCFKEAHGKEQVDASQFYKSDDVSVDFNHRPATENQQIINEIYVFLCNSSVWPGYIKRHLMLVYP